MRRAAIPIYDATAPVVCTASRADLAARVAQLERLREAHLGVERSRHGIVVRFPRGGPLGDDVRGFAIDEKGCCAFWGFAVDDTGDELVLRWDGPPSVGDLLDDLVRYFAGAELPPAISGLL